jgi:acyl-CoA thioester hydrolase
MEQTLALSAYPFQITVPTRFTDVDASGAIGHIGLSRYHEDARVAFIRDLIKRNASGTRQWRAFLARARTEVFESARYPKTISLGVGIFGVSERSYGIEVSTFQDGARVARARALSVAVDQSGKAAHLAGESQRILTSAQLPGEHWSFGGKPETARKLENYAHHLELPTRFSDTDAMGHLNNVALIRYCDEARIALLSSAMSGDCCAFGSLELLDISYLREGRFMPDIAIGTSIRGIEGTSVGVSQGLFQQGNCVAACESVLRLPVDVIHRLGGAPALLGAPAPN